MPGHCNSPRLARDALVLGPSAALNRDPTSTSRSGQLQEQGFSVEVAERIAALRDRQQGPSTSQSGPYLRDGAEKIRWISPLPL